MKIYIAMIHDRHADSSVIAFTTPSAAIAYAKSEAMLLARHPSDYEESVVTGWLFFAEYSSEGDYVRVVETELHEEEK